MADEKLELAKAYVQIVPSMDGISGALESALGGSTFDSLGTTAGTAFSNAFEKIFEASVQFMAEAVETSMDFDKAMSQVQATLGDSADSMGELRDYAREMGRSTKFTATESAEALNYMALAGYDAEKSMAMLPGVLSLAAAGDYDLARASDQVTDIQSALGLSMAETTALIDKMAKTSSKSNTNVEQLGDAMLQIGGTAKNLKGGTTELAAALGILANNGMKGVEDGTKLRNMINNLVKPSKDAAAIMDEYGLSLYDAEGNMRSLNDVFSDFAAVTATMTQEDRQHLISTIFNARDMKAAEALISSCGDKWSDLEEKIEDSVGAAQEMADVQIDNLYGDTELLKSAFSDLKIAVSDEVTPTLRKLVEGLTEELPKVVENFDKIKSTFHDLTNILLPLAPLLPVLFQGQIAAAVGTITTAVEALTVACMANPILTGAVIAALVGGALANAIDEATEQIDEIPHPELNYTEEEAALVDKAAKGFQTQAEAESNLVEIENALNAAKAERTRLQKEAEKYPENLYPEEAVSYRVALENVNDAIGGLSAAYLSASRQVKQFGSDNADTMGNVITYYDTATEAAKNSQLAAAEASVEWGKALDQQKAVEAHSAVMKAVTDELKDYIVTAGNETVALTQNQYDRIQEIASAYVEAVNEQEQAISATIDPFKTFNRTVDTSFSDLWTYMGENQTALAEWEKGLEKLENTKGFSTDLLEELESAGLASYETVMALSNANTTQIKNYSSAWEYLQDEIRTVSEKRNKKLLEDSEKTIADLVNLPKNNKDRMLESAEILAAALPEGYGKEIKTKGEAEIIKVTDNMVHATVNSIEAELGIVGDYSKVTENYGEMTVKGIAKGITDNTGIAENAAEELGQRIKDQINKKFRFGSPSKVMREWGSFITLGLAGGIEDETETAVKAAETLATTVADEFEKPFTADFDVNTPTYSAYSVGSAEPGDAPGNSGDVVINFSVGDEIVATKVFDKVNLLLGTSASGYARGYF